MAGGVDPSGGFKGIYLTSVNMLSLLRTFQLAKAFMPVDMPTPVAALGQSLQDGIPLVVVTRGCFGRDLDYGLGPVRNENQRQVWETVRHMRAEMPQVLITCIDLPINCTADIVQSCLEPPLNEYRELMYHEGTWYTPALIPAASLAMWKAERRREKAGKSAKASGEGMVSFNRKKFAWVDESAFYKDMAVLGWKEVLQVRPPPVAPKRTDLNFVDREKVEVKPIKDSKPSAAQATFRKALASAREANDAKAMQAAIKAYLDRAKWYEKEGIQEAIATCQEVAGLLRGAGKQADAADVVGMAVGAYLYLNEVEKGLQMATELRTSAADAKVLVKAARMELDCYFALGDMDKALEAARQAKASLASKGDAEAAADAAGLIVAALTSKGDIDEALAEATEASKVMDKAGQARGWLLVAETQRVKSGLDEADSDKKASLAEAGKAYKVARALFQELGKKQQEGEALQGAVGAAMAADDFVEARTLAKALQAFSDYEETKVLGATGAQLVAAAHVRNFNEAGSFLEGGSEEMLAAAKAAVAALEQLGDRARRGTAQETLREAVRLATSNA
eukprot:CAMPEP_0170256630 /NCGR_PEP_ID=MMETSP0116_2-20130129/28170_1 /TAXON_ID=400756 /ORGANISM="Durinskia baltica, Strain CSIRO CS-38" /LENGTH=565 /DNA_ID=CAMNT_0010507643 /DNA_START=7 /DNA_END=1704 /DNA_ORIENTATION=+